NTLAYAVCAVNSFCWNKYWTFRRHDRVTRAEILRFVATTAGGIALNDFLLWLAGHIWLPASGHTALWTNVAKVVAIGGTVLLSYLGMRLWVFARRASHPPASASQLAAKALDQRIALSRALARHGISVVLPAYNEEQAIESTLADVLSTLDEWNADFEVIVVNDGSADRTGAMVDAVMRRDARVCLITHPTNQGYGAALADGFAAATKDLTFFMDADGQFAIRDLARLLIHIDGADAVLGYRLHRQDSGLRLLNAWGWNVLVALVLVVRVRDLDCAFKLFHTRFLQEHPPETRSALINAELLYRLNSAGAIYQQVGVRHLPRRGGRATGANPHVIARALWDLATSARKWRRETATIRLQAREAGG
ncbi:MAG TPA: glycosyltransferase, partial [Ktedonobacterales bacterium]|nr:glycosyltransferase [Ktedonobacterales bacterium]